MLDRDSSESPTYGGQEGSAYNGHFGGTCYRPLFVSNQFGDVERCTLRPGNVHSADNWLAVLEPVISRYRGTVKRLYFRGDAAFANLEIHEVPEAEPIGYTIRLPANVVLQRRIDLGYNVPAAYLARLPGVTRERYSSPRLHGRLHNHQPSACSRWCHVRNLNGTSTRTTMRGPVNGKPRLLCNGGNQSGARRFGLIRVLKNPAAPSILHCRRRICSIIDWPALLTLEH